MLRSLVGSEMCIRDRCWKMVRCHERVGVVVVVVVVAVVVVVVVVVRVCVLSLIHI